MNNKTHNLVKVNHMQASVGDTLDYSAHRLSNMAPTVHGEDLTRGEASLVCD